MKKFLSIMACMVMILVGGVALASCGRDEFAGAEKISAQEMSAYINSEEVVSQFNGYNMTMHILDEKIFDASVASVDEKLQVAMFFNVPSMEEVASMKMSMYLLDNVVYVSSDSGKYKTAYDSNNAEFSQLQTALQFNGNLIAMIEDAYINSSFGNLSIKKVVEGDLVKFLISTNQTSTNGNSSYTMKLVYQENTLIELTETVKVGKKVLSSASISAFNGNIEFPSNLETDPEYKTV